MWSIALHSFIGTLLGEALFRRWGFWICGKDAVSASPEQLDVIRSRPYVGLCCCAPFCSQTHTINIPSHSIVHIELKKFPITIWRCFPSP